ncbi:MAG: DUF3553 domain-containing protein, partial [Actinomycetota bacterium]|nr:DUF3553 domain-containing protein [Actinomycetota bacterium]
LLHHAKDLNLQRFLTARRPKPDALRAVLSAFDAATPAGAGLTASEIGDQSGLSSARRTAAVNLLEQAQALLAGADGRFTRTGLPVEEAVERAVEIAEQRREMVRSRIELMRNYAETTDCRRRLLLGYFGERRAEPCGYCDNCEADTTREPDLAADAEAASEGLEPQVAVRHPEWGDGVVMATESDRVTVLFAEHGYKTLALDAVRERDLLVPVDKAR